MVAAAKLVAHYVAASLQTGATADDMNAVLHEITETIIISEIWVTDAQGNI